MFRLCVRDVCAAAFVVLAAMPLPAGDWPQWRGAQRDGIAAGERMRSDWSARPPKLLWMKAGMGSGYASLAIVGGRLYTTGNRNDAQAVICADASTGEVLWATPITDRNPRHSYAGSRCTPTVDGERVYAVASDGRIACLKAADGTLVWSRPFSDWGGKMMSGWGYSESPLVDGEWVLCTPGGRDAMIVALNKLTGQEVWRAAVPALGEAGKDGAGYASIMISHGGGVKQYVQTIGRGVIGVRARDGKYLWGYNRVANGTANIPTPIIAGDLVFASTSYKTGSVLLRLSSAGSDEVRAEEVYFLDGRETFENHHGGMILLDGYIYAGHAQNQGFPTCIEMKSGRIVWGGKLRPEGQGSAAVTCVDGKLIFRYQDGTVVLIEASPKAYKVLGKFTPEYQEDKSWSHPVVVDGKLYLREQDKLMCYDVRP